MQTNRINTSANVGAEKLLRYAESTTVHEGVPKYVNGHYSRIYNAMTGKIGSLNPHYNGGRCVRSDGYIAILILNPNGKGKYVMEHRHLMEQYLGRKLKKGEEVHHINGCKTDNRIENLLVLSAADHAKLHQDELKEKFGEEYYLEAKRRINKGEPYKELFTCLQEW